jgi:hypothetical protein
MYLIPDKILEEFFEIYLDVKPDNTKEVYRLKKKYYDWVEKNPRDRMRLAITFNYNYLRQQIEDCFESDEYETNDGVVINEQMLRTCLKYLTASDVKEMLEWVCESINEPSYYDLVHEILDNKLTNNLYQIVEQLNKEEINTQQG